MNKHFKLTLAFLLTTAAITGCSGGRLRNLISRSDYKTLDEVEAQDALTAEREAAADQKAFANAEKELSESKGLLVSDESKVESDADNLDSPEEKKSRFSLAGLFRRGDKPEEDEVTPDPFVAGNQIASSEFEAADDTETKTASLDAQTSAKKPQGGGDRVEEQSTADLFKETADDVESRATAELERAIADMDTKTDALPDSFSEYLKANRESIQETVEEKSEETTGEIDAMFAEVEQNVVEETNEAVEEFDSILNQIAKVESPGVKPQLDSELFPGLGDVVGGSDADETPTVQVTPRGKPEAASTATLFDEITAPKQNQPSIAGSDPFQQASEKHGFQKLTRNDPWAAFDSSPDAPSTAAVNSISDSLAWNDSQPVEKPSKDQGAFDWASLQADGPVSNGLTQVSSVDFAPSQPEFSDEPFVSEESGPELVIPVNTAPAPINFEESFPEFEALENATGNAGFESPAPANEPEAGQEATASTSVEPAGARNRWSTRTWFLVIGCVLVVGMLLLPERKNRANA